MWPLDLRCGFSKLLLLRDISTREKIKSMRGASYDQVSKTRAQVVHQHDQRDQNNYDGGGFLILKRPKTCAHQVTDAAGADQAQDRGGTNVGLQPIQGKRDQIRQYLRQYRKGKNLRVAGSC